MESDTEILDRLFSMFDKTGNDQINYKEFVGGLAPLCHGTVEEKLACKSFSVWLHSLMFTNLPFQLGSKSAPSVEEVLRVPYSFLRCSC